MKKLLGEGKRGLEFLAIFVLVFLPSYWLFNTFLDYYLKMLTTILSGFLLNLFGANSAAAFDGSWRLSSSAFNAEIVSLCAGALEVSVLAGICFATLDRSLLQRFYGFLFGSVILVFVLNPLRIAITLLLFSPSAPEWSELVHGILFRVVLITAIVGWYSLWYLKLSRKKK